MIFGLKPKITREFKEETQFVQTSKMSRIILIAKLNSQNLVFKEYKQTDYC